MPNPMQAKNTKELINIVSTYGYVETKGNGSSHRIFKCAGHAPLSIPNHRELSPGTRRQISKLILGESYYKH